jgi:hypothetical protein
MGAPNGRLVHKGGGIRTKSTTRPSSKYICIYVYRYIYVYIYIYMLHYSYMIFLIFVGAPRGPKGGALPGPKETGFQGPRKGPRRAWGMSRAQGRNPSRAQGNGRSRAQGKCPLGYRPGGPMNAQTRDGHQGPGYGDPINQGGGWIWEITPPAYGPEYSGWWGPGTHPLRQRSPSLCGLVFQWAH